MMKINLFVGSDCLCSTLTHRQRGWSFKKNVSNTLSKPYFDLGNR